jgi:hypothetical protein
MLAVEMEDIRAGGALPDGKEVAGKWHIYPK